MAGVLPVALLVVLAAALTALRLRARRRRPMARFWLLPSRVDEATTDAVTALLKAWHEQLQVRWWRRLVAGQPGLTLEAHALDERRRPARALLLGAPPDAIRALSGPLNACYPDVRLIPHEPRPGRPRAAAAAQARPLHPPRRGRAARRRRAGHGRPARHARRARRVRRVVQFAITPAPVLVERFGRLLMRARERALGRARGRSHVGELELSGGEATQWTALWFTAVRDRRAVVGRVPPARRRARRRLGREPADRAARARVQRPGARAPDARPRRAAAVAADRRAVVRRARRAVLAAVAAAAQRRVRALLGPARDRAAAGPAPARPGSRARPRRRRLRRPARRATWRRTSR